jgi:hypothetical protein
MNKQHKVLDMNESMVLEELLDETETLNPLSLFTTPIRYAPTIGDQQAEIARAAYRKNGVDNDAPPRVEVHPVHTPDRAVSVIRQEACPYCKSLTYEVNYSALKGVVQIKGACSCCGYQAQSIRGMAAEEH